MSHLRFGAIFLGLALVSPALLADEEVPIQNWPSPPYWTPPAASASDRASEGRTLSTLTKQAVAALPSAPLPFVAITPCRLIDTRLVEGSGITGEWGPPSLVAGLLTDPASLDRVFTFTGAAHCTIPSAAQAVSAYITTINYTGNGRITAYPAGSATRPFVATLNYRTAAGIGVTGQVLPLSSAGQVSIFTNQNTDLIVDLNGYYSPLGALPTGTNGQTLRSNGSAWEASSTLTNTGSGVDVAGPLSASVSAGTGVSGQSTSGDAVWGTSSTTGKAGVRGTNHINGGIGVYGESANGTGLWGQATSGYGVRGYSTSMTGVYGHSETVEGVLGASTSSHGVVGVAVGAYKAGVHGINSVLTTSYGVYGESELGTGVRGRSSSGYGVVGASFSGYAVYCSGNGGYTGTWGSLSDERLKRGVETLDRALEKVLAIRGVTFCWKTEEAPEKILSKEPQIGVVAQEVEVVVPEVVVTGPDGYKAVDYAKLTPLLIEAIKSQQCEIDELRSRLAKLESR